MARKSRPKKSEALEIRVSHEDKQAFMDAVSRRGTTASDVIRKAMAHFAQAELSRSHRMKMKLLAGIAVLAISAVSIGSWEIIQRGDFGAAYAEEITSNFQMRIGVQDNGTERVFRTNSRIVITPEEPAAFDFDLPSSPILAALLPEGQEISSGVLRVEVAMQALPESELYVYEINVVVIDQDGRHYQTSVSPAISTRIDSVASVESSFGTQADIIFNLIPLSLGG